ncbi:AraC family transcriptional regulator [Algoriphagus sediminis]|uniref:AraC family transcriptional regulator n=1 Tax=Algoriphagus sediminis TaxID=3057113 RepID=A0ABT7YD23_9BACT|nr:AraC family transcriptional regulator [Algoriphagus sediminis]MDN3204387.1 AraC family transcriptional regulator [Algoriphagus sediminis]
MKKPLKKSRIPNTNALVIKDLVAPFFDVNWHFHSEYQLFTVLEGKGTRFVGDSIKPFREGDMVLTGPNLPHLWRNDKAYFQPKSDLFTRGIVIYFPKSFLNDSIFRFEEFEDIALLLEQSNYGVEIRGETNHMVQNLMLEMLEQKGSGQVIRLLQILQLIASSDQVELIANPGYINSHKESERDRMGKVHDYVMNHFQGKVSLKEVADLTNLSDSAFSRFFKARMNRSFSDFLTEVRIAHACKLLHESDTNISEVAFASGFHTLSNFNRLFLKRTNKTPLEYRKEHQRNFSRA